MVISSLSETTPLAAASSIGRRLAMVSQFCRGHLAGREKDEITNCRSAVLDGFAVFEAVDTSSGLNCRR
jgi:hypothetical protein